MGGGGGSLLVSRKAVLSEPARVHAAHPVAMCMWKAPFLQPALLSGGRNLWDILHMENVFLFMCRTVLGTLSLWGKHWEEPVSTSCCASGFLQVLN